MSTGSEDFAGRVLAWFDRHGRKDLPWQHNKTHYRVWVSEIMLQQTQVASVIGYYQRFMQRFPDVRSLAAADIDEVLGLWSGLGYYARARNLHRCAQTVVTDFDGEFPGSQQALQDLPGIGRSTAAAILALVEGQRCAILDGNVKRVLARHEAIAGWPGKNAVADALWQVAERYTPHERVADYTQGMMDLGATLCRRTRPDCQACPVRVSCIARADNTVHDYPGKKPKKPKPQKQCVFMMLRREDKALWLERRPPTGIWGGLYCFPEFQDVPEIPAGFDVNAQYRLPEFVHKFTHFDLTITPLLVEGAFTDERVNDADGRWLSPGQMADVGLPRPVASLIDSLQSGSLQQESLL